MATRYQKIKPAKPLAPYVHEIWVQENYNNAAPEGHRPTKVLPVPRIDILFHYRDPFVQINNGHRELLPRCYIVGQKTKPIEVAATGDTGIIILCFHPWGAAPFFKLPLDELLNISLDLSLLLGTRMIATIEARILGARDTAERVHLIQEFFIELLDTNKKDELVYESVFRINRSVGKSTVSRVADDLHISRRQFIRRFKAAIGISPKSFSNIIRFQKAIFYLKSGVSWSEIAAQCGYYDQSHFIKEFKGFSGRSPHQLFGDGSPTALMKSFNSADVSHFYNTIYL